MAITIPIVSEFKGAGIKRAMAEFKQLEGASKKAQFAIKKAAVPAAAALAGLAVAAFDATKAAIEDAKSQELLARQLKVSTGATESTIKATEDWITTQGKLLGVADDELRPALANLSRVTGDVKKAQEAAATAMDIAAAKGMPLETVVTALEKAYGGNFKALALIAPELRDMIKEGAPLEVIMGELNKRFGGAAQTAAETTAGKFQRISLRMGELKESIGAKLLPVIERLLPYLEKMMTWAENNQPLVLGIAAAFAALAVAIIAVNIAMALNPAVLIVAAIIALGIALVAAYRKFEGFRKVADIVMRAVGGYFKVLGKIYGAVFDGLMGAARTAFNFIAKLWNNTVGKLSFTIPSWVPGIGGKGFDVPDIPLWGEKTPTARGGGVPMMAAGGIVDRPTLALIGEAGPEAVIPLSKLDNMGKGQTVVNITVQGGDPNAVVDALRRYTRQNGAISGVRIA
jgi:hypothetical protein